MSQNRVDRNSDFKAFFDKAETVFSRFKNDDTSVKRLEPIYSFYIIPGSRAGHDNNRIVELFFGKRSYDTQRRKTVYSLVEEGATLLYEKRDDGFVTVLLYPAKAENLRMNQEIIFLHQRLSPSKLKSIKRLRRHWKDLMALMEYSCLDGSPSTLQRLRVWWLCRNKSVVENKVWRRSKVNNWLWLTIKYIMTVSLSGLIVSLTLWCIDAGKNDKVEEQLIKLNQEIKKFNEAKVYTDTSKVLQDHK